MPTRILTKEDVKKIITIEDCFHCVENAYKIYSSRNIIQPPIISFDIPAHNGELDIKSGYNISDEMIGIKAASGYTDNPAKYGLDSMYALMLLFDAKTSYPLCILDAGMITYYRTAAAGAFAASLLAKPDSKVMAVIGTGGLAKMHLLATATYFNLEEVYVYGNDVSQKESFINEMAASMPEIHFVNCDNAKQAVYNADIIATATPSRSAIIMKQWLKPGVHINAFGCDTQGKQELDPEIFSNARIFVDSIDECSRRGECQHALAQGIITCDDLAGEIGEIPLGLKSGRENDTQITIFDAVGLSIQDITTAQMLWKKAEDNQLGTQITMA